MSAPVYRTPFTPTPGGSTPSARVSPEEGWRDLWGFFWLSLVNTLVIAVVGIAVWWFVH